MNCNTPKVIHLKSKEAPVVFHKVEIEAILGDDTTMSPSKLPYRNVLLEYKANGHIYLYSSDGIPTMLSDGGNIEEAKKYTDKIAEELSSEIVSTKDELEASIERLGEKIGGVEDKIPTKISQLENDSGYLTEHQSLSNYYTKSQVDSKIPTKVSQLENDEGYLTKHQSLADYYTKGQTDTKIDAKADKATTLAGYGITDAYTKTETTSQINSAVNGKASEIEAKIPVKLSDLTNDTGFITSTVSNLTNYYKKSETYTKSEINALVDAIPKFTISVVDALPATGDSATIYLVKSGSDEQNIYDEYIYVNSKWEKLGTQKVDLSDYYTKEQADALLSNKADKTSLSTVATSGSYNDLTNKPTIGNATITIQKNGANVNSFTTNATANKTINLQLAKADVGLGNVDNTSDANKPVSTAVQSALDLKANSADLSKVATSGKYADLTGRPTIPTKVSQLENDKGYLTDHQSLADYYKKSETDSLLDLKADKNLGVKEYKGIIGKANDTSNGSFFFGEIRPTSNDTQWRVKYTIEAVIDNAARAHDGTSQHIVEHFGGYASSTTYACFNNFVNASYRPLYYHELGIAKAAALTAGRGYLLGVALRSSYGPTNASYKRNFKITILELENCELEMWDEMKIYSSIWNANYWTLSSRDGYNDGLRESGDDNSFDRFYFGASTIKAISTRPMYGGQIVMSGDNGNTWFSIQTKARAVSVNNTCATEGFQPEYVAYYAGSTTVAAGATSATHQLYWWLRIDPRYSSNKTSFTNMKNVYLVCRYDAETDLFYLNQGNWMTQDIPTEEDGYYYIRIGYMYNTTSGMIMYPDRQIYAFRNGKFRVVDPRILNLFTDGDGSSY